MNIKKVESIFVLVGRLEHGADLLEGLTEAARVHGVRLGHLAAVGAVGRARIAFYDQQRQTYEEVAFEQDLEIASLIGNISLKDGEPMVHAHVTFAAPDGSMVGGHLAPGCTVFACEFTITALEGARLERKLDEETGLPLWPSS